MNDDDMFTSQVQMCVHKHHLVFFMHSLRRRIPSHCYTYIWCDWRRPALLYISNHPSSFCCLSGETPSPLSPPLALLAGHWASLEMQSLQRVVGPSWDFLPTRVAWKISPGIQEARPNHLNWLLSVRRNSCLKQLPVRAEDMNDWLWWGN